MFKFRPGEKRKLKKLSKNLRKLRKKKGISQEQVARNIDVSVKQYHTMESDNPKKVNIVYLLRLTKLYSVTLDNLLK